MLTKLITRFLCLLTFLTLNAMALPTTWQDLTPGLEYAKINFLGLSGGNIQAFRFNLKDYQLKLAFTQNENHSLSSSTIPDLMAAYKAVIGVNGGFFSTDLKPLGLRINNGQIKNPLKSTAWWGVFFTRNSKAYIVAQKDFTPDSKIDFAVQSGPRLVVNGAIPNLKQGIAYRTVLGITRKGEVVLAVTDNLPLSTQEMAEIMQKSEAEGGLACVQALNLDGGSSTQLYVHLKDFILNVPGFNKVTDAVLVTPKN